jgi:hypothetical protein
MQQKIGYIIWNCEISEKIKVILYKTYYLYNGTYEAETWIWLRDIKQLTSSSTDEVSVQY